MTFFNFLITMFWKNQGLDLDQNLDPDPSFYFGSGCVKIIWIGSGKLLLNYTYIKYMYRCLIITVISVLILDCVCFFLLSQCLVISFIIKFIFVFYRWYKSDRKNSNYWTTTGKQTISRIFVVRTLKYENKPPLNLNKHF